MTPSNTVLVAGAREADAAREVVIKAHVVGQGGVQSSNAVQAIEANERVFAASGALPPPFDLESLCMLLENSNALRPNIDSYCANIDSHGHRFEPVIDFEAEDASERIQLAMYSERLWLREHGKLEAGVPVEPTPEEVTSKKKELVELARMEKTRLDNWAEFCCTDASLITVRRRTRMDIETLGNGYWEILRNAGGQIALIVYVPGFTVRLLPLEQAPVQVQMRVKVSDISYQSVPVARSFRRYVQVVEGAEPVFFKELGDPRVLSRRTGDVFTSVDELRRADAQDQPATEILHFKVHSPRSAYGVPRWMGTLLEVLGSRQASEVNFLYFTNKSVPPLALLVSGGRLSKSSIPRIESFIENHIKGKDNFFKILVIEAESNRAAGELQHSGKVTVEFHPLTDAQQSDALFSNYDERNVDKVGSSFRLPRLLRGDARDFNRSCNCADTETLTERGWKRFDEIAEGERIAAYDAFSGAVVYVVPAQKHVYEVDEELLHFSSQGADILVTEEHRMWVRPNGRVEGEWALVPASKLYQARFAFRCAPERYTWDGERLTDVAVERIASCPRAVRHHHGPVDPDAWLEFIGYFVSDGTLYKRKVEPVYVALDQRPGPVYEAMRACLDRLGFRYSAFSTKSGCSRLAISNRCLAQWLGVNCGDNSFERRVPESYLHLHEDQLVILFDALMAGDGHKVQRGRAHLVDYSTSSSKLADQVQKLALHLGMRARKTIAKMSSGGRPAYRVWVCDRQTVHLEQHHIQRVPYKGKVYCFSVPGYELFVTRRSGKVTIQGNTALAALHFAEEQVFEPERQEFDFLINRKLLSDMGIRFWRFVSNAPVTRDPQVMADTVKNLVTANVLTPEEGRRLAGDVFNTEFKAIRAPWVKQPVPLTLAGFGEPVAEAGVPGGGDGTARRTGERTEAAEEEARSAQRRFARLKPTQMEREVVHVPDEELRSWIEPDPEVAHG